LRIKYYNQFCPKISKNSVFNLFLFFFKSRQMLKFKINELKTQIYLHGIEIATTFVHKATKY
jgi:hypothetical protein